MENPVHCILCWKFTKHRIDSVKSNREGIHLILISSVFPELIIGLYWIREEGDSYFEATKAVPWNSVGMMLLRVYYIFHGRICESTV